jgi:glycosyltransferase involved in cell wall biosynthesis
LGVTRVDHCGIEGSTNFFPGKNPQIALRAFLQIRDRIPHHIVLAGRRVREFFLHMGFTEADFERVQFINFLPFEELPKLYNLAEIVVHVPQYEGFGFALMGALACGVPTVTSKTGACPEVVEDAALLADPFDADNVAEKILQLVTDRALRADLRTKGLRRMSELTWDRTARITLDALVQVVEGTRGEVEHRMNI